MGIELLKIGVKTKKFVMFTISECFRSVCNHPFLVGFLCFLILLHGLSPFIFSLLVSASPILICTAVLLGVLLSYGEPNIPEIEIEERTTFEAASMETGGLGDAAVVEQNGNYFVERFSEKGEAFSDDTDPLIKERSWEIGPNDGELGDLKLKAQCINEKLKDKVLESDDEKSEADSFDSEKVNVDSLDSPPRSPWKRIQELEEEEEDEGGEENNASDSGSDGAESSSPDASLADIMPMLDELHPLLDDETPQPVYTSHSGSESDVTSDKSSESSSKSRELYNESEENNGNLEAQDDDNEDGRGDKGDHKESAITWTEEDEKNLMDLGSSEIERNQRLENLILRRRARKTMRMVPERNLIDLEVIDSYPFGLAPILTRAPNPFDLPNDSYGKNSGLPPIPGSAPSVLLQRRNPFDIPYESSEEKPNLMGDGFKEEFTASFQSREMIFRRHDSFNVGPSLFAPDTKDVRMRRYSVPDGTVLEESSYSSFRRQVSELSESKVSPVPETESIVSVVNFEYRKLSDEDNRKEKKEAFEGPLGDQQPISHQEEDVNREPELVSKIGNVSEHVGHGSQSLKDEESLELDHVEKREVEVSELKVELEDVADHYLQESVMEVQATEYHADYEGGEQVPRRNSSSSSLSEASGVFTEVHDEGLSMLEEGREGILTQTSKGSTNPSISGTLDVEVPQRTPVYDSSPRENRNNISSSSVSSVEREREGRCLEIETCISSNDEILHETSTTHPVDEPQPMDVVSTREDDNVNSDFSEVEKESEMEISEVSIPLKSSDGASVEENLVELAKADENIHNVDKSSEEQIEVSEPLFEGQLRGEDIIGMDEGQTVRSPDSDAYAYQRADEMLISMPFVEGITYPFHDAKEMHAPKFEHLDEVHASTALPESPEDVQITSNLDMPEVQELDHDIPLKLNSPLKSEVKKKALNLSPDFSSGLSSSIETTGSHVNIQTTIEEVDDVKEIDEELLSELDNVGDFSVSQWRSSSGESECLVSVEERFARQVEARTMGVADVDSITENKTSSAKHMIASHWEASENGTSSKEKEARPVYPAVSPCYRDNISEVPELEVQSKEKYVDYVSEKDGSAFQETEITSKGQDNTETTSRIPEFEVSKIEDVYLGIKETTAKETEKPVILEPPHAEPVVKETSDEHSKNGAPDDNSSVMRPSRETSVLEVGPIGRDATLDSKKPLSDSVDRGQGISWESLAVEDVALGGITTPPPIDKVFDVKPLETDEDKMCASVVGSRVQRIGLTAEGSDHQVEANEDSHSDVSTKGKGKITRSSSSSSSSSSESSSSDSERN